MRLKLSSDPLYKNSIFIMLSSGCTAAIGFAFWTLAARLYSSEDIGISTALISSLSLLLVLSRVGLEHSLIRFFPEKDKSRLFSTCLLVTTGLATILGIGFLATLRIWSTSLTVIQGYSYLFLAYLAAGSMISVTGTAFVALRKAEKYFYQSLFTATKVVFLFPFMFLGSIGVFSSYGISLVIAVAASILLLSRSGIRFGKIDREFLRETSHFSLGNYVGELLIVTPNQILPLLVLNSLGPANAAYYYVAYIVMAILLVIPAAFSVSLFVEGSHGGLVELKARRALRGILLLLIPAIVVMILFGDVFLSIFGEAYSQCYDLLVIMAIASLPMSVFFVLCSIARIRKNLMAIVSLGALLFVSIIGLSIPFANWFGLVGIGYAWILAYTLSSSIAFIILRR